MEDTSLDQFYESVGTEQPAHGEWAGMIPTMETPAPKRIHELMIGASRWAMQGGKYWGISESVEQLPSGCYQPAMNPSIGVYLQAQTLHTDNLLELPDSKTEKVLAEIKEFTKLEPAFKKHGFLYKRGVLLHGPAGSGKTSCLHLVMRLFQREMNGIVLLADDPGLTTTALHLLRTIEPKRMVVCVIEDLDELVNHHGPSGYLSLLDGEAQIDNCLFISTTNFPERLDRRFVDRPSRFDTVEYIGMPSAAARMAYLRHKEPELGVEVLEAMVKATEGLSVAHLREMIILTQCFGRTVEEAEKRLNASRQRPPHSEKNPDRPTGAGFRPFRTGLSTSAAGYAAEEKFAN